MALTGGCQCGAIRYSIDGEAAHNVLCHCTDCRKSAGAPVVAWLALPSEAVTVTGTPVVYASSEHARRHFCGTCGTGLFYTNPVALPGITDVQSATLDDPDAITPGAHIQVADRISWMEHAHELPTFARYPGM